MIHGTGVVAILLDMLAGGRTSKRLTSRVPENIVCSARGDRDRAFVTGADHGGSRACPRLRARRPLISLDFVC